MDIISELMSACNAANTEKITERKKQTEKIRQLLTRSSCVKELDSNSALKIKHEKRHGRLFAWDNLFLMTCRILEKEGESQRKAKETHSATTQSNREKTKQDVCTLVKTVVRLADKRGQRNLKGADVVSFVLSIVADEFTCSSFGMDLSSMLFKDILRVRHYFAEIPLKARHELINRYCKLLQNPPPKFDRYVIACIIYNVTLGASKQGDIRGRKLLPLLDAYFQDIRKESAMQVLEQMMGTLNLVAHSLAVNGRIQICHLGESLASPLLYLWARRPSDLLKDELVKFFQLQMTVHHPRGAQTEDVGAYAVDWDEWKSVTKKVYEAVYTDIQEKMSRSRFITGNRDGGELKEAFVDLAVDVCHQIFLERTSVLDVTLQQTNPGSAHKRRRIQSGWSLLLGSIQEHSKGLAIPWLQLILGLVTKYPNSVPEEEAVELVTSLHTVQAETKHLETLRWVLSCLHAVALCCGKVSDELKWSPTTLAKMSPVWPKVWAATLRTLSLHQAETEGFSLLSILLKNSLVECDNSVWTLFLPTICAVSPGSLSFLAQYLREYDLPEQYRPPIFASTVEAPGKNSHPLRCQLLSWLFPSSEQLEDELSAPVVTAQKVCPRLLAEVAVGLILRDSRSTAAMTNSPAATKGYGGDNIATIYQQTSFDMPLVDVTDEAGDVSFSSGRTQVRPSTRTGSSTLGVVQDQLYSQTFCDAQNLLEFPDATLGIAESIFWQCSFLTKIMVSLLRHSVLGASNITDSPLYTQLQNLLRRGGSILHELFNKDPNLTLGKVIPALNELMGSSDSPESHQVSLVMRRLTPKNLIRTLMDIARGSSDSSGQLERSDDDLFDMDDDDNHSFHDPQPRVDEMDLQDDFHVAQSQDEAGFSVGNSAGCENLLSPRHLTEAQQQRIKVVHILCRWTRLQSDGCDGTSTDGEVSTRTVTDNLLDLIDDERGWDISKAYDLQLFESITEEMTVVGSQLEGKDMEALSVALWTVGKAYRRDQEICSFVIDMMTALVPHLASLQEDMVDAAMKEARRTCLHLVGVFRKLSTELQYSHSTRMSLARCMTALVKADPRGSWALLSQSGQGHVDSETRLLDIFPELLQDHHHPVRLLAAANLKSLFVTTMAEGPRPKSREEQDAMFDSIYITLTQAMGLEGRLSVDEQQDEKVGRTSSLLHSLSAIAAHSAICEKKATFAFYQAVRENSLNQDLVTKVLEQVARGLHYGDLKTFSAARLSYILTEWLGSGYTLAEFPHQLAGFASLVDFYRTHLQVLVPVLIMRQRLEEVQTVSSRLQMDHTAVLRDCLAKVIVRVLPVFAAADGEAEGAAVRSVASTNQDKRQYNQAARAYDMMVETFQQEAVYKCIVNSLHDIMFDLLMTLYDEDTNKRIEQPTPSPPYFSRRIIALTFDYITKCYQMPVNSVVARLTKTHDGVQRVLLLLRQALSNTCCLYERRRILSMYELFVEMLLVEFSERLSSSFPFVVRDVLVTFMSLLQEVMPPEMIKDTPLARNVAHACLKLLEDVCKAVIELYVQELMPFLQSLVGMLIKYAPLKNRVGKKSLHLLRVLVVEHQEELAPAIQMLAPFPDTDMFLELRQVHHQVKYADGPFTLKQELQHFIDARSSLPLVFGRNLEALCFLQTQLSMHKEELASLVAEVKGAASSPRSPSVVVRLLSELLHLCSSRDEELVAVAARCLGELGPVDLSVGALQPRPPHPELTTALALYAEDPKAQQYCHILHLLDSYLIDSSVDVVTAASEVLKHLLATQIGSTFYQDYNANSDKPFKYLYPFKTTKKKILHLPEQDHSEQHFRASVDRRELWVPPAADHATWLRGVVHALLESGAIYDEVLLVLTDICRVKVELCEVVLPFLIYEVLLQGKAVHREIISSHVQAFITAHCEQFDQAESASPPGTTSNSPRRDGEVPVYQNPASLRVVLSIIQYLRLQDRPTSGRQLAKTPWDNNFWLDVDYLQLARAASSCSAYFTTLLYAEIWCNQHWEPLAVRSSSHKGSQQSSSSSRPVSEDCWERELSQLEALSSLQGGSISVQPLMRDAYRNLGDPDAVYGCGAGRLADSKARIQTYEHEDEWSKAVCAYDLLLTQPSSTSTQAGLLQALQKFGAGHVLNKYLEGLAAGGAESAEVREFQYEAAWRTGQWDKATPTRFTDCGYHESLYSGLWAIKANDHVMLKCATDQARSACLLVMRDISLESVRSLYPLLSRLQCLVQLEDVAHHSQNQDMSELFAKWKLQDTLLHPTYDYVEQPLLLRCRLLQLLTDDVEPQTRCRGSSAQLQMALLHQLEQFARRSREGSRHQVAERAMADLHAVTVDGENSLLPWRLEEARLYWARGEIGIAKDLIKGLLTALRTKEDTAVLYPKCLGIYGSWLAETRSESPKVVMDQYLVAAVEMLEETDAHSDTALEAHLALARYADAQYQQIVDYMASPTFEAKQALARQSKADAEDLRRMGEKPSRYLRTLDKQSAIDEAEVEAMQTDKQGFLMHAVSNYIRCLTIGDGHDLRIFRLASLWFDNKTSYAVNTEIVNALHGIKSYKFLPLMYQLAARMGTTSNEQLFLLTLEQLLEQTTKDHPHHALPVILALAHARKDDDYLKGRAALSGSRRASHSRGSQASDDENDEDRVKAAKALVSRLKSTPRADIVVDMERLAEAYIELANFNVDQYKRETNALKLPTHLTLTRIKDLTTVAILTSDTPVDPTGEYRDIVYIHAFESTFKLAGGINLPKIICCIGSDGQPCRQLVKGKDDLRQDAVMQQVFGMVNHLLLQEADTRGRHLHVRTYKVIPLSQRSGLLEWCEGTIPFGEYLVGAKTGAHQRYRPKDLPASSCRAELSAAHDPKKKKCKITAYMSVCERFQPVFRHFFMEKFPDPTDWYQRRLAYTRSVATNSIVGYILGLGDRHVQNILIDCKTAELIHIDLGVAFEQGKILPTPETIPFRLTRDVVDGMGVTGVEGVFRRCCEATLETLRGSGAEALLTILTVLLYDPLYAWTISPAKAFALQSHRDGRHVDPSEASFEGNTTVAAGGDLPEVADAGRGAGTAGEQVNQVAERVLLRLQQKLTGVEQGVHLSVSGHVNLLIQEAIDPHNLCRVFPGWQPYI